MKLMQAELRRLRSRAQPFVSRRTWFEAAALLIALLAAWPLLSEPGLLNTRGGGDSPFLLQRLHQLLLALQQGHFPVRWMADANYGYGYPFFNYYAPLSLYVAAAFRLLGASYVGALQLAQVAAFLLAAWATFRLARRWFHSDAAALLASAAYTVAPFHMVNVYVRGDSLAEFWAMALYPLVLLAADLLLGEGRGRLGFAALALSYAALALSHNISALIFSPFLLLCLVLLAFQDGKLRWTALGRALLALSLGLALSAWFWLPALAEKSLVQMGPVTEGYFNFAHHFWSGDLVQPSFLFDYTVAGRSAFRMGLMQALLILIGMAALLWIWRRRPGSAPSSPILLFLLTGLFIATVMITPLSRPLWDYLPLLSFTQFPWRFLSVQALFGALASASVIAVLPARGYARPLVLLAALVLLLLSTLGALTTDHLLVRDSDVSARRLAEYEWFTGNIGSTVSAEYLPVGVAPRPFTSPWLERGERWRARTLAGAAQAELVVRRATAQTWQVRVGEGPATLLFPTLYWAGWQATIDDQPLSLAAAPGSGLTMAQIPVGTHTVILTLERTPTRLIAELLSLLAAIVLLLALIWWSRGRLAELPFLLRTTLLTLLPLLLLLFAAFLFVVLRSQPAADSSLLNWDFAQAAYLHPSSAGVPFAPSESDNGGLRLEDYHYGEALLAPGQTFHVTLQWSTEEAVATTATLALVTPAVHRFPQAPLLVSERLPLQPGETTYELSIPENAPAGLYVPRLHLEGWQPLLPSGQPRGDLFLQPIEVAAQRDTATGQRPLEVQPRAVTLEGPPPALAREPVGLFDCAQAAPSAARLQLQLAWLTSWPLSRNYLASLRLTGANGQEVAQCDMQPGYGFQPSSHWPVGQWVDDWLSLPLSPALPDAAPYALLVRLYDARGESVLTRRLGELVWQGENLHFRPTQPLFTLPPGLLPAEVTVARLARLRGYELQQASEQLSLTLYWQALAPGAEDYVRFVHLLDPRTGQIVRREDGTPVQVDSMPRNNSYPTSQWTEGEIVADPLLLDLRGVSPGAYQLAVGFYPPATPADRLPLTDSAGVVLPNGYFLLPTEVTFGP